MIDFDYWKSNYGITLVSFDLILAKQIGWSRTKETNACCLQNELAELVLEATELRYTLQQSLNNYADNVDAPEAASLRTKLADAYAALRRYESLSNQANSLIREVEAEVAKTAACEIQHEVDDETGDLYVSRASFERWLEKKKEALARIASVPVVAAKPPVVRDKMKRQEERLKEMRLSLYPDPSKEPRWSAKSSGVKAEVKEALANDPLFTAPTSFDKAWERAFNEEKRKRGSRTTISTFTRY